MFDIGWGEFVVIGTVALVVIGPKELPGVLRTVGQTVAKIRRMAGEFQGQFQEALREAELDDVRKTVSGLNDSVASGSSFNPIQTIRDEIKGAVDGRDTSVTVTGTAAETPIVPPQGAASVQAALPEPPPVPDLTPDQIRAAFVTERPQTDAVAVPDSSATPAPYAFEDFPQGSTVAAPADEAKPKRSRRKTTAAAEADPPPTATDEAPAAPKRRARKTKAAAAGEPADGGENA